MKTILLSATAALLFGTAPATASVITLGSTYAESCFRAAEARDPRERAMDACDNALNGEALTPGDIVGTHVNRGILFMVAGDFRRANRDFDEALYLNPKEPEAWLNKAIAQLKGGNSRAALELVERSMALGTQKLALAYFVRGVAHEDTGNIRGAYADLRKAAALAPQWKEPALELTRFKVRGR